MTITVCPFCGIASEEAHDSQEACIRALHQEIEKARHLLESSGPPAIDLPAGVSVKAGVNVEAGVSVEAGFSRPGDRSDHGPDSE